MTMSEKNGKPKILLVDDEPNILMALEFLMEQQGFDVRKAGNGQEALNTLGFYQADIVLLDVMMPGMDGFEVASNIRKISAYDNCRIIFLTAKGTDADKWNGYRSGGEVYLTKPFDNDRLLDTINEVLEFG